MTQFGLLADIKTGNGTILRNASFLNQHLAVSSTLGTFMFQDPRNLFSILCENDLY